jgi:hypothetical protein
MSNTDSGRSAGTPPGVLLSLAAPRRRPRPDRVARRRSLIGMLAAALHSAVMSDGVYPSVMRAHWP